MYLKTLFLILSSSLWAAQPQALSQEWVLAQVRQNNPELKAAHDGAQAMDSEAWMAYAWMPPKASVEWMGLAWPKADLGTSMARKLSLSQELPFPGRTLLKGRAASHAAHRAVAMQRMAVEKKLGEAREAWHQLAAADWVLKAIKNQLEITGEMSRLSAKRGKFGQQDRMAQFINTMLSMEVADEESMLPMLKQQRRAAESALNRLMGAPADRALPPAQLDVEMLLRTPIPDEEALKKEALASNPEIEEGESHVLYAEAKRHVAYSAWLPDLMVSGTLTDWSVGTQESSAMLGVSLPFAWFWGTAGEAAAAGSELDQAHAVLDATRLKVLEDTRVALGELKATLEALDITWNKTLPRAEEGLKLASSGFKTTALGPSEILMALQDYRMIQEKAGALIAQAGKAISMLEMARARASAPAATKTETHHD